MTSPPPTSPVLPLRGRVFRALALQPEAPVADWLGRLDAALARDPALFRGKALVLDAGALAAERAELPALVAALAGRGLRLSGIEGADPRGEAEGDLPPFLPTGHARGEAIAISLAPPPPPLASLTIEGSVRSGRSVVHPEGDVTVMGSVASGAEILAGGSVHVYGALRGRVIAGAAKNPRARIYCRKFEPELLGIDRLVRTAEDMGNHLRGQAVQIWLDGGAIKIAALG